MHAVDWDSDGDIDLLVGGGYGHVYVVPNNTVTGPYAFGEPKQLSAAGEPIEVPEGEAGPFAADWDGDGRRDLLVGAGDGSVLWYRNVGSSSSPELAAAQVVIPPPQEGSLRGARAKIFVTDWNEDGLLDIVLGDHGREFEKQLSEEEQQWREEVRRRQAALLREWASVFREYRQLLRATKPADAPLRDQWQNQLETLREDLQRLNEIRTRHGQQELALQPGKQHHGRVWLMLRRSRTGQSADASE